MAPTGAEAPSRPPASGALRPGDDVGHRRFATIEDPLALEAGGQLGGDDAPLVVAYETWGELDSDRSNAVLLLHALTGDSHAAGSMGPGHPTPGWWDAAIGPGRPIDTDRFYVIAPNVLGGCQGTTGPASLAADGEPLGSRFPTITIRDQVATELSLLDSLGIERLHGVVGGSMGGMRALELAVMAPDRLDRLVVMACGPAASAEQIALIRSQILAIELDPGFRGGDYYDAAPGDGPWRGLGIARRIGQVSYRTRAELSERFSHEPQPGEDPLHGGRFAVESYLDHHAEKLAQRFDANSYRVLSQAMNLHDVGRGRGGITQALGSITARTTVLGFDSDRLYLPEEQEALASRIPGIDAARILSSPLGHDAFLLETVAVSPFLRSALG